LGVPHNIRILEYGTNERSAPDYCGDFRPSRREVAAFLRRSRVLSALEHNEMYDHRPCYATGTAIFFGMGARWEIFVGGAGKVVFPDDTTVLIADPHKASDAHVSAALSNPSLERP
jgi:hypothetical protein